MGASRNRLKYRRQRREYAHAVQSLRHWTRAYLLTYEREVRNRSRRSRRSDRDDCKDCDESAARIRDLSNLTDELRGIRTKLNRVRRQMWLPAFQGMHPREVPTPV